MKNSLTGIGCLTRKWRRTDRRRAGQRGSFSFVLLFGFHSFHLSGEKNTHQQNQSNLQAYSIQKPQDKRSWLKY